MAQANEQARGYDHATFREANGAERSMPRQLYEKIPLAERIRMLLEDRVAFYRDGARVPAREALKVSSRG